MQEAVKIDRATWPRTQQFDFYCGFDNPCYSVNVQLEAEPLFQFARQTGQSVFLLGLYAILRATNSIPQMRQRIVDGQPVEFARIDAMTPIMTANEQFNQLWCVYQPTFADFVRDITPKLAAAKEGIPSLPQQYAESFICASCMPWMHFTAVSQAEYFFGQSVPILAWGKMKHGRVPVSCKVNHALVDGLHISRFFDSIEQAFTDPKSL